MPAELVIPREQADALHGALVSMRMTLRNEIQNRRKRGTLTDTDEQAGLAEWHRLDALKDDLEGHGCVSPLIASRQRHDQREPTFRGSPPPTDAVTIVEDRDWLATTVLRGLGMSAYIMSALIGQGAERDSEWPLDEIKTYLLTFRQLEALLDSLGWPVDVSAEPGYPWPRTFRDLSRE